MRPLGVGRSNGRKLARTKKHGTSEIDPERVPRVAFVDHCALLSGAELALTRLLPALAVNAHVVLAEEGPLVERLAQVGIVTTVLPMRQRTRTLSRDRVVPGPAAVRAVIDTAFYVWLLRGWLRAHDFDVVHTNSLKAAVYGGLAGRLAGIPVVWHIRDRIAADYLPIPAVGFIRLLSYLLPTAVVTNSKATSATLPRARRTLARVLVLGDATNIEPRQGVHVVYNAADFGGPRSASSVHGDELAIGIVGRLAPWKGQDVFLRAFAQAFPTGGHAVVVGSAMFGEQAYERTLHDLVRTLGIEGRVEFVGFREDVAAELRKLDVFVHASVIPEPFGQVIIEAMSAGLPVIASGAGGPLEIITDEVDGMFHKPGDADDLASAMQRLAKDPDLRGRLGAAAQRSVERFRPENIARDLMMIYYDVVTR
jgi:glycosyltransferase involved in cell wall biosynthesis